jgi:hypothetical protein
MPGVGPVVALTYRAIDRVKCASGRPDKLLKRQQIRSVRWSGAPCLISNL